MTENQPQNPATPPPRPAAPAQAAAQSAAKAPAQKPAQSNGGANDGLGPVFLRNQFYRDGYRTWMKIALIQAVAIGLLVIGIVFAYTSNKPQMRYFATTSDGRLIEMVPLNRPNLSNTALLSWSAQAASDIMTFGFHDYRKRLQDSSNYFTTRGWESFTNALQQSRVIEAVEARQQVISAVPNGAPVIVQEGVLNNVYRWVIEMPMIITYKSGNTTRPDSVLVTLVVVRVPTLDNPNGVGIEQWIAANR